MNGGIPISQRRLLSRVMRVFNSWPRLVLRSPLHGLMSYRVMLLTFRGRKSGKSYTLPVSYVEDEGTLLIASDRPWRKNLRTGERVSVRLKGSERSARAEVFTQEDEVARLFEIILPENSPLGRFLGIRRSPLSRFLGIRVGPDGNPNPDDLRQAVGRGVAVIRLRLE